MDTLDEVSTTDALGRSVPPRRYRTAAEKRQIVEETLARGTSVAVIARRYEVNANLVFGWRKLYQKGLLEAAPGTAALLPVRVTEDAEPKRRSLTRGARKSIRRPRSTRHQDSIEIELAGGGRVRVQ